MDSEVRAYRGRDIMHEGALFRGYFWRIWPEKLLSAVSVRAAPCFPPQRNRAQVSVYGLIG